MTKAAPTPDPQISRWSIVVPFVTLASVVAVGLSTTGAVSGLLLLPLVVLLFATVASLALYALYLFVQMVRHSSDFSDPRRLEVTGPKPGKRQMAVARAGLPAAPVGVAIAMTVLLPEATAALRAARADRIQTSLIQTSLNLALGSALASICLTIPTVAVLSVVMGQSLTLGLEAEHIVLLLLSLFMATLSLAMGCTTILQGGVHLVIFGAFLTLSAIP